MENGSIKPQIKFVLDFMINLYTKFYFDMYNPYEENEQILTVGGPTDRQTCGQQQSNMLKEKIIHLWTPYEM